MVQFQSLADAGGREPERVGSLEETIQQHQRVAQGMAQQHVTGANGAEPSSTSLTGNGVIAEGVTKIGFKQWGRRYRLVVGASTTGLHSTLSWARCGNRRHPPSSSQRHRRRREAWRAALRELVHQYGSGDRNIPTRPWRKPNFNSTSRIPRPPKGDDMSTLIDE